MKNNNDLRSKAEQKNIYMFGGFKARRVTHLFQSNFITLVL